VSAPSPEDLAREFAEIADETLSSESDPEAYEAEMALLRTRFAALIRSVQEPLEQEIARLRLGKTANVVARDRLRKAVWEQRNRRLHTEAEVARLTEEVARVRSNCDLFADRAERNEHEVARITRRVQELEEQCCK
jgi:ubiquinone biosynthesis protein UbiJ